MDFQKLLYGTNRKLRSLALRKYPDFDIEKMARMCISLVEPKRDNRGNVTQHPFNMIFKHIKDSKWNEVFSDVIAQVDTGDEAFPLIITPDTLVYSDQLVDFLDNVVVGTLHGTAFHFKDIDGQHEFFKNYDFSKLELRKVKFTNCNNINIDLPIDTIQLDQCSNITFGCKYKSLIFQKCDMEINNEMMPTELLGILNCNYTVADITTTPEKIQVFNVELDEKRDLFIKSCPNVILSRCKNFDWLDGIETVTINDSIYYI